MQTPDQLCSTVRIKFEHVGFFLLCIFIGHDDDIIICNGQKSNLHAMYSCIYSMWQGLR